jgi:hypothetical protein
MGQWIYSQLSCPGYVLWLNKRKNKIEKKGAVFTGTNTIILTTPELLLSSRKSPLNAVKSKPLTQIFLNQSTPKFLLNIQSMQKILTVDSGSSISTLQSGIAQEVVTCTPYM